MMRRLDSCYQISDMAAAWVAGERHWEEKAKNIREEKVTTEENKTVSVVKQRNEESDTE